MQNLSTQSNTEFVFDWVQQLTTNSNLALQRANFRKKLAAESKPVEMQNNKLCLLSVTPSGADDFAQYYIKQLLSQQQDQKPLDVYYILCGHRQQLYRDDCQQSQIKKILNQTIESQIQSSIAIRKPSLDTKNDGSGRLARACRRNSLTGKRCHKTMDASLVNTLYVRTNYNLIGDKEWRVFKPDVVTMCLQNVTEKWADKNLAHQDCSVTLAERTKFAPKKDEKSAGSDVKLSDAQMEQKMRQQSTNSVHKRPTAGRTIALRKVLLLQLLQSLSVHHVQQFVLTHSTEKYRRRKLNLAEEEEWRSILCLMREFAASAGYRCNFFGVTERKHNNKIDALIEPPLWTNCVILTRHPVLPLCHVLSQTCFSTYTKQATRFIFNSSPDHSRHTAEDTRDGGSDEVISSRKRKRFQDNNQTTETDNHNVEEKASRYRKKVRKQSEQSQNLQWSVHYFEAIASTLAVTNENTKAQ